MDSQYPISFVKIDPLTLSYCPCLSTCIGNYNATPPPPPPTHTHTHTIFLQKYSLTGYPQNNR